jgi:hypothetical protein
VEVAVGLLEAQSAVEVEFTGGSFTDASGLLRRNRQRALLRWMMSRSESDFIGNATSARYFVGLFDW